MNTNPLITGIHHVSALSSDAQKSLEFYSGILGLRLVKKTVNFEAPEGYHLYFGNEEGMPGSILTFFPYAGLKQGRHGTGMLNTTSFSVAFHSIDFWLERFKKFNIPHKHPQERLEEEVFVYFEDYDGLGLELVFNDKDNRKGYGKGIIRKENAIKGLHNVEIWGKNDARTAALLTEYLDHQLVSEKGNRFRFAANDTPGNYVDLLSTPDAPKGLRGSGTVHHIAFATQDADTQYQVREAIGKAGLEVTPILDRKYFQSIYFRTPGGVLFEVATSGPGFIVDELFDHLGERLMLPIQFEGQRTSLEKQLIPLKLDLSKFRDA